MEGMPVFWAAKRAFWRAFSLKLAAFSAGSFSFGKSPSVSTSASGSLSSSFISSIFPLFFVASTILIRSKNFRGGDLREKVFLKVSELFFQLFFLECGQLRYAFFREYQKPSQFFFCKRGRLGRALNLHYLSGSRHYDIHVNLRRCVFLIGEVQEFFSTHYANACCGNGVEYRAFIYGPRVHKTVQCVRKGDKRPCY